MGRDPRAAGLPRRALAGVIDLALGSTALLAALAEWALVAHRRLPFGERFDAAQARLGACIADRRVMRAFTVTDPVVTVLGRRVRGPGSRVTRIRRVDARTGGPESVRSAVIRALAQLALQQAMQRLNAPARERLAARDAERERVVAQLRATLADDPEALKRAIGAIGLARGRGCLIAMARGQALGWVPRLTALLSPRRRTAIDRLAGVAVIRDARRGAAVSRASAAGRRSRAGGRRRRPGRRR